jgi:hypothetical protein
MIGASTKFTIVQPLNGDSTDPSAPGSVDNSLSVAIKATDQYDNVASGEQRTVTLTATGSAIVANAGVVQFTNGQATIVVSDSVAESITLRLVDSASTGVDVTSSVVVTIAAGLCSCQSGFCSIEPSLRVLLRI